MREAVTVSLRRRGNDTQEERERERENGRGNEHWFQGENIALFRNRANGYCGPFTGRQAAVSLYLIGWRGGKKRRGVNWRTLDRRTLKYSSALRHLRNPGWRCWMEETVSFLPLFILLISFLFSFFSFIQVYFGEGGLIGQDVRWGNLLEMLSRFGIFMKSLYLILVCNKYFWKLFFLLCHLLKTVQYEEGMFHIWKCIYNLIRG